MTNATETRAEHTPGPWSVDDCRGDGWAGPYSLRVIGQSDRGPVVAKVNENEPESAVIIGCGGDPEANAHLIAAAPELLEAAERVLRNIEHPADEFNPPAVRDLRTAIDKAKGESP